MSTAQVSEILDNRYRLDTQIARGGMSTVFRGKDLRLGRDVAVKVMDDRYLDDAVFRSRFVREAKSMAQLHHPNIVDVYDFNSTGDHAYLVMELIDGGTLRELLSERGPMPPHMATQVMRGLLTGLAVAHQEGLVHRDIKPDNVLIDQDHRIKLTDFGLVRAVAESDRTSDQIVGTVSYLSPEQVAGGAIGPESDVYSAGIVLFELLTGTTPFIGDTQIAHAMQRLSQDVPAPSSRIEGVPALFDELVAAATHRSSKERFPTAAEFLAALEDVATELALPSAKIPLPRNTAVARATEVIAPRPAPRADATSVLPTYTPPAPAASETAIFPVSAPEPTPAVPAVAAPQEVAERPSDSEAPKPVSNRSPVKLTVWLIVVAMLLTAVAIGGWWFGSGRYGEIPQILGMDKASAMSAVSDAGFKPVAEETYSDDVPAGQAAGTQPPFGQRVPRSKDVAVLISKGQPTVPAVPTNGDVAEFRREVEARTLTLEFGEETYSDSIPAGGIATVSPAAGVTVRTRSKVTAQLSKGPAPVEVPDVTGKDQQAATELLTSAGLTVRNVTEVFSPQQPKGTVLAISPGAGSQLTKGSEVELKVSNSLTVPDVAGLSMEEAQGVLKELGFVVYTQETNDAREVLHAVVGMSEKPGTLINPEAAEITLKVAGRVKVLSVIGLSVEEATQKLHKQGLDITIRSKGNLVLMQSPRGGSKVNPGTTIKLTTI